MDCRDKPRNDTDIPMKQCRHACAESWIGVRTVLLSVRRPADGIEIGRVRHHVRLVGDAAQENLAALVGHFHRNLPLVDGQNADKVGRRRQM